MQPKFFQNTFMLLFLAALAWQMVNLVWLAAGHSSAKLTLTLNSGQASAAIGNLGSLHTGKVFGLFGDVEQKPAVSSARPIAVDAPQTRLNLVLKGVVTAADPSQAGAIIEDDKRKSAYYKVGGMLPGRAKLVEVFADRVILERNGLRETLRFKEQTSRRTRSGARRNSVANNVPRRIESPEDFVNEAERRLGANPAVALKTVGLSAVKPGQAEGYVFNGRNPMLSKLNLKKGDIIRSVNGMPIGDVQKDRKLLRELYQQGNISVEVERDGTFFTVNYPIR